MCHSAALLEPEGSFSGAEELGIDQTVHLLQFALTKGTSEEAPALVFNMDSYDVLLGMGFGQTFGYVDPLTVEFIWRVV